MDDEKSLGKIGDSGIELFAGPTIGKLTNTVLKLIEPATYSLTLAGGAALTGVVTATLVTVQRLQATIIYQNEYYRTSVEIAIPTEAALDAASDAIKRIQQREAPDAMKATAIAAVMRKFEYRMTVINSTNG